jgi:hypothetical protein
MGRGLFFEAKLKFDPPPVSSTQPIATASFGIAPSPELFENTAPLMLAVTVPEIPAT